MQFYNSIIHELKIGKLAPKWKWDKKRRIIRR